MVIRNFETKKYRISLLDLKDGGVYIQFYLKLNHFSQTNYKLIRQIRLTNAEFKCFSEFVNLATLKFFLKA